MKKKIIQLKNWFNRFELGGENRWKKTDFLFVFIPTIGIMSDEFEFEIQIIWLTFGIGIIFNKKV